jgi:hypothetical protein
MLVPPRPLSKLRGGGHAGGLLVAYCEQHPGTVAVGSSGATIVGSGPSAGSWMPADVTAGSACRCEFRACDGRKARRRVR